MVWLDGLYFVGFVGLVGKPAKRSCSMVQLLQSMGAVIYVKTNIPQSLMVCPHPPCKYIPYAQMD